MAQAIFLLERGKTDMTERPTNASSYTAGMGNIKICITSQSKYAQAYPTQYGTHVFHCMTESTNAW